MKRRLAFCFGVALAWCGTADAQTIRPCTDLYSEMACLNEGRPISRPEDAIKVEIDDLKERMTQLEKFVKAFLAFLPECSGDPPEHTPCLFLGEPEAK